MLSVGGHICSKPLLPRPRQRHKGALFCIRTPYPQLSVKSPHFGLSEGRHSCKAEVGLEGEGLTLTSGQRSTFFSKHHPLRHFGGRQSLGQSEHHIPGCAIGFCTGLWPKLSQWHSSGVARLAGSGLAATRPSCHIS